MVELAKFGLFQICGIIFITHIFVRMFRKLYDRAKYTVTCKITKCWEWIDWPLWGMKYIKRERCHSRCICTGAFPILASHYFTPVLRSPALTWILGSYFNLPLWIYSLALAIRTELETTQSIYGPVLCTCFGIFSQAIPSDRFRVCIVKDLFPFIEDTLCRSHIIFR